MSISEAGLVLSGKRSWRSVDGDNDTVMLKEVGFGVAMANGEPQVKEAADYITLSNEEDGVAQAIERFVLGGGEARC